jgi:hypothetical protein
MWIEYDCGMLNVKHVIKFEVYASCSKKTWIHLRDTELQDDDEVSLRVLALTIDGGWAEVFQVSDTFANAKKTCFKKINGWSW